MSEQHEIDFKLDVTRKLASIEADVKSIPRLLEAKLDPLIAMHDTVQEHDRQIARWQGANGLLGVLLVILSALYGHLKRWF